MTKKAAIYARISKDIEGRQLGVQRQESLCRELAERLGYEVSVVYIDNDISASTISTKPRPEYAAMLDAARAGDFSAILAYSNSRLTRRPKEYIDLIDLFRAHRVRIHTVASSDVDLSTAEGRALGITVSAWDAAEAERASERVKAAVDQRAASGRWHGGATPFGYRVKKGEDPVPYPPEVDRIKEAVERLLAGDKLYSIVVDWNKRGLTTKKGGAWKSGNVRAILLNRTLLGETKAGVKGWKALLDESTFDRINRLLTDPSRSTTKSPGVKGGKYALGGGLSVCGECGHRLITHGSRGKTKLACLPRVFPTSIDPSTGKVKVLGACGHTTIDHERLREYVFSKVVEAVSANPRWAQRRSEATPEKEAKLAALEDERAESELKRKRMTDAYVDGLIEERDFKQRVAGFKAEYEAISKRIDGMLGATTISSALTDGLENWREWTQMRQRSFLMALIDRVEVAPHPKGIPTSLRIRGGKGETEEQFSERSEKWLAGVMDTRVTIVTK